MDYVYSRINEAAEYIQDQLAAETRLLKSGVWEDVANYYREHYPNKPYLSGPLKLKKKVIRRLEEALLTMRKAAVYARAVEWPTSGDDGYESFCIGLDEELAKVEKTGGVE